MTPNKTAVIAGAGGAVGPALISALENAGYTVAGIARGASGQGAAHWYTADLSDVAQTERACDDILAQHGVPSVFIYNAHRFLIEPLENTSVEDFEAVWRTDTLGAFVAVKKLVPEMAKQGGGTVVFSGATASIRGSARFAAFASAKFALRGLAQSLAREYGPQGVHVAHVLIDGLIDGGHAQGLFDVAQEDCIAPTALAETYLSLINQPRSAWTHELDIRPFAGKF